MKKRYTNGLVFGGGGAKGAYQIGVWQALSESELEIDFVSGTSIGAFNAALLATGDIEHAKAVWEKLSTLKMARLSYLSPLALMVHLGNLFINFFRTPFGMPGRPLELYFGRSHLPRGLKVVNFLTALSFIVFYLIYFFDKTTLLTNILVLVIFGVGIIQPLLHFLMPRMSLGSDRILKDLVENSLDWERICSSDLRVHVTVAQEVDAYDIPIRVQVDDSRDDYGQIKVFGDSVTPPESLRRYRAEGAKVVISCYPAIHELPTSVGKKCLAASMSLPVGVLRAVKIGNSRLMDGGVVDNVPVFPMLASGVDRVFVVPLSPKTPLERLFGTRDSEEMHQNLYWIDRWRSEAGLKRVFTLDSSPTAHKENDWLIFIRPPKSLGFSLFATLYFSPTRTQRLMDRGYSDAKKVLNELNIRAEIS